MKQVAPEGSSSSRGFHPMITANSVSNRAMRIQVKDAAGKGNRTKIKNESEILMAADLLPSIGVATANYWSRRRAHVVSH